MKLAVGSTGAYPWRRAHNLALPAQVVFHVWIPAGVIAWRVAITPGSSTVLTALGMSGTAAHVGVPFFSTPNIDTLAGDGVNEIEQRFLSTTLPKRATTRAVGWSISDASQASLFLNMGEH